MCKSYHAQHFFTLYLPHNVANSDRCIGLKTNATSGFGDNRSHNELGVTPVIVVLRDYTYIYVILAEISLWISSLLYLKYLINNEFSDMSFRDQPADCQSMLPLTSKERYLPP